MIAIYILFAVVALGIIIWFISMGVKAGPETEYTPYYKKQFLMSKAESHFYKVIITAVGDKYNVVPQVQLSRIVGVKAEERRSKTYYQYLNKIDRKSVDFVLFGKEQFNPIAVIELDDSSHSRSDRVIRDEFVNKVINSVGLKMIRINWSNTYNVDAIKKIIS
jgi:hypothetical protein